VPTESSRVAILPRGVASRVITGAVSRAAWAVAVAILVLTVPVVVDVMLARGLGARLWVPIACLAAMLGLLVLCWRRPGPATRLAYLLGGGGVAFVYALALLAADPSFNDEAGFLLNRPAMVLVLGGVTIVRPVLGVLWSFAGYVTAMAVLVLAALVAGVAVAPGWGPTLAFLVYAGAFLALAAIAVRHARSIPDLARLERDTRRLSIENQFEQRAAAVVHDTVLSDLTAVMNSPGPLDDRVRARFRADVATLGDAAWLRESADATTAAPLDAALRNAFDLVVSDFQWRGLSVDVTGDSDHVIRMSPDAAASLVAAVRACLDNVLDHAGTGSAELVISTLPDSVTVMVIDHGAGFDPAAVAADRLGLKSSVASRIRAHGGSVRLWSTPGSGTSVLISVPGTPLDAEAGRAR
jgi:signal transduction histidine kinase